MPIKIIIFFASVALLLAITINMMNDGSEKDISVLGISYGDKYDVIESRFGIANETRPLVDENIIVQNGHFVTCDYNGVSITFDTGSDFAIEDGDVVEMDICTSQIALASGITIGSKVEEVMKIYDITKIYNGDEDSLISKRTIEGVRRNDAHIDDYSDYCYYYMEESPIGFVFLIKGGEVNRILIRHFTAY